MAKRLQNIVSGDKGIMTKLVQEWGMIQMQTSWSIESCMSFVDNTQAAPTPPPILFFCVGPSTAEGSTGFGNTVEPLYNGHLGTNHFWVIVAVI